MKNQLRVLLLASVLVLTGCVSVVQKPESADSDGATSESSGVAVETSAEMSAFEFEKFFQELALLDEAGRVGRLETEGMSQSSFRSRALDIYGPTMPTKLWLTDKISGSSSVSASAVLASFGLFFEGKIGEAAPSKDDESTVYAIDSLEIRAGETARVLVYGPAAVAVAAPSKATTPAPSFTVDFKVRGPLYRATRIRSHEVYVYPRPETSSGDFTPFNFAVILRPAAVAECRLYRGGVAKGASYTTNSKGTVEAYSFTFMDLVNEPLERLRVKCKSGSYRAESREFDVVGR